jgi:hypothetical protein
MKESRIRKGEYRRCCGIRKRNECGGKEMENGIIRKEGIKGK